MSIPSYRRNVSLGIASSFKPVCFPASIEQVSPDHYLTRRAYEAHQRFANSYHLLNKIGERTLRAALADTIEQVVGDLADITLREVEFRKAQSPSGLKSIVTELLEDDYRIVLDTSPRPGQPWEGNESHCIGLIPIGNDRFKPVSNWLHRGMGESVSLDDMYEVLAVPSGNFSKRYPFFHANVTALPPAA